MKNNDIKFETLKKPIRKKIIIGSIVIVAIVSAITLTTSRAKFRLTQSIPVVRGKIYYYNGDLNVMAMYKQKDGSTCIDDSCYDEMAETDIMPSSGYVINETKSYCKVIDTIDNEARLYTENGKHIIENLRKKDKCYLYFDKVQVTNAASLIASRKINISSPDFSKTAITNEGIYATYDGMYGGTSYYWRGAVNDNHVIFANYCWRIIRINGDGTIRMIYNGAIQSRNTCLGNGANGGKVQIGESAYSDVDSGLGSYAGWTYDGNKQRPSTVENDGTVGTNSTIKGVVEDWYKANIADGGYDDKVASGRYCNDRNLNYGSSWYPTTDYIIWFAAVSRLLNEKSPNLRCAGGDTYIVKVGLITADEMSFAGGVYGIDNLDYFLFNDNGYWSMTPFDYSYASQRTFVIESNGQIYANGRTWTNGGVRPVINLSTDVTFNSGSDGTQNNPYIVQ